MAAERVLYWTRGSPPAWRAMIGLEAKGLSYESKKLDFSKRSPVVFYRSRVGVFLEEHKSPEVMALNPRGQVPTFKDGDACVNESGAVLLYLESQYPDPPLLPSDPVQKARVLQRMFEVVVTHDKIGAYGRPKVYGKEDPQEEQHLEDVKEEFARWEEYIAQQNYAATDEFTLADAMMGPTCLFAEDLGMTFKDYPNMKKYVEKLKEHPFVAKTIEHYLPLDGFPPFMNVF